MTQVFISYSRKDLTFVEQLATDLKANGLEVWYDVSGLEGGDRWNREIERAIRDSQYMIVVLSPDSMEAEWVDKEFLLASRLKIKIVPLLYRTCELRLAYINLQYIDIQGGKYKQNFNQILRVLNIQPKPPTPVKKPGLSGEDISTWLKENLEEVHLENPKILTLSNGMEFMRVRAGKFLMGSTNENELAYRRDEGFQHTVDIPYDYWMARFAVTNEQYNLYAKAKDINHPLDDWEQKKDHPVYYLRWDDAMAYCQWLNDLLKGELPSGLDVRLPTEAEWEKAARGEKGNEWPWGNKFDKNKCNSAEGGKRDTMPVGSYSPRGDSPYGCADMVGNVWEWTHSLFIDFPYQVNDGREDEIASGARVLRGGSFDSYGWSARCAYRSAVIFFSDDRWGFRVVVAPPISDIAKL